MFDKAKAEEIANDLGLSLERAEVKMDGAPWLQNAKVVQRYGLTLVDVANVLAWSALPMRQRCGISKSELQAIHQSALKLKQRLRNSQPNSRARICWNIARMAVMATSTLLEKDRT